MKKRFAFFSVFVVILFLASCAPKDVSEEKIPVEGKEFDTEENLLSNETTEEENIEEEIMETISEEQTAVTVAKKTIFVCKCMIINLAIIFSNERRNQQQQCALWLVEVGYQCIHNAELVSRSDQDLCKPGQFAVIVFAHPVIHRI